MYGVTRHVHDKACLQQLGSKGLTLNPKRCKFLQQSVNFFGQIFSSQGTCPDPKRVEDLQKAFVPKSLSEVTVYLVWSITVQNIFKIMQLLLHP